MDILGQCREHIAEEAKAEMRIKIGSVKTDIHMKISN